MTELKPYLIQFDFDEYVQGYETARGVYVLVYAKDEASAIKTIKKRYYKARNLYSRTLWDTLEDQSND